MAFSEYGNYDGIGLADLVRKKQVSARELLDEAIVRTERQRILTCRELFGPGSVPGTHEFIFDAPFEQIHIEHIARDRRVFAEGALVAAAWLIGKHGIFTIKDVLGDSSA